jgi:hypothetical protein
MTNPSPKIRVSDERWSQIHRHVLHVGFHEGAPSTPDRRRVSDNDVIDLLADHESMCAELSRLRERERALVEKAVSAGIEAEHARWLVSSSAGQMDKVPDIADRVLREWYELATPEQRALGSLWWCIHHEVILEPLTEPIENRVRFIRERKAAHEVETRLRAMRPVKGPLPMEVQQAGAAWQQAYAAWRQAGAAWQQAGAAWQQAYAAWQQAYAAWQQAYAAYQQADAAWRQALREHAPEIDALFAVECADVPWGPDGLVFPESGKP